MTDMRRVQFKPSERFQLARRFSRVVPSSSSSGMRQDDALHRYWSPTRNGIYRALRGAAGRLRLWCSCKRDASVRRS